MEQAPLLSPVLHTCTWERALNTHMQVFHRQVHIQTDQLLAMLKQHSKHSEEKPTSSIETGTQNQAEREERERDERKKRKET